MNEGFNILSQFPVEKGFSFIESLVKRGFRQSDDELSCNLYKGTLYDYETDSLVNVEIKKSFHTTEDSSPYIWIYKESYGDKECIYRGIEPQSSFMSQLLMSHLFPTQGFADSYVNVGGETEEVKTCDVDYAPSDKLAVALGIYEFKETTQKVYPEHFKEMESRGVYNPYSFKRVFKRGQIWILFDYIEICISYDGGRNFLFNQYTIKDYELASLLHFAIAPSSDQRYLRTKMGNDDATRLYSFLSSDIIDCYPKKTTGILREHLKEIRNLRETLNLKLNK